MKTLRLLCTIGILLFAFPTLQAQDFLQKAKNYLDAGMCKEAKRAYDAYLVEHPEGNDEVKRRIDKCVPHSPVKPAQPVVKKTQVATLSVVDVTTTSVTCRGNVTSDGGGAIIERGICYDVYKNEASLPSTRKKATTTGTGSFSIMLNGLEQGKKFVVRAYATNSAGTSYGESVTFTTKKDAPLPPPQEKTYKIGDDAESILGYSGYKIAYLDKTGKHGFAIKYYEYSEHTSESDFNPSIIELMMMFENRYILGLSEEYWSSTLYKRGWAVDFYKTFDFSTGTVKIKKTYRDKCHRIWIERF